MAKIRGNDLIVMVRRDSSWKTVAFGTTCEIDVNAETIDVGSPSSGRWRRRKVKRISWRMSTGHLLSDVSQDVDLFALLAAASEVDVSFTTVESHDLPMADPPQYVPDSRFHLSGKAFVTRYTVTGKRGDYAVASATFTGSGPLSTPQS